jgi:hypothetical protein
VNHARDLGRLVVTDDLVLAALAELEDEEPACRALLAEGAFPTRVLDEIRTHGDGAAGESQGLIFPASYYSMHGRAQAFSASLRAGESTAEDVLLALIWDPISHSSRVLWRLGIDRQAVVSRLRNLGVAVPETPLPAQRAITWGDRVWFERTQASRVLDHLGAALPPAKRWTFAYEEERAWAQAEADVDLPSLVRAALTTS